MVCKAEKSRHFVMRWGSVPLTLADLDLAIKQTKYIASSKEYNIMTDASTFEQKQKLFQEFWRKRDPRPGCPAKHQHGRILQPCSVFQRTFFSFYRRLAHRYGYGFHTSRGRQALSTAIRSRLIQNRTKFGPTTNLTRNLFSSMKMVLVITGWSRRSEIWCNALIDSAIFGMAHTTVSRITHHRRLSGISFVMALLPFVLVSQTKIASIEFYGNHYFSQRELIESLPLSRGAEFSHDRLRNSVRSVVDRYREEGFFFSRVDSVQRLFSTDSTTVGLDFFLDEGKQSLIGRIGISGVSAFSSDDIRKRLETAPGALLRQTILEKDIDDIITRYENNGYPLAKVRVDSLAIDSLDASRLSFVLAVTEGPRVYLTEIKVQGNTLTRSNVIAREAYLQPFELYNQEKVDRIRRRLERLGIFSSVGEPQLYLSRDPSLTDSVTGGILICVQEGNTNNFDGIVGYIPPATGGESGDIYGQCRRVDEKPVWDGTESSCALAAGESIYSGT